VSDTSDTIIAGLTVAEVAAKLRVSKDKIRRWIDAGELAAVNTSTNLCGRPRWVISPNSLAAFEQRRRGGPAPKPQRRGRRKVGLIDFYPD